MATYKEIKGVTVQTRDEDPVTNVGSWSSGGDLNTARYALGGAGLTPQANIVFGGEGQGTGNQAITESYNGTSWTELNDMPAGRSFNAGVGTSTAAVSFGGVAPGAVDSVYEWNGSTWSSNPNAYPAAYYSMAAAGTATAAIISGGNPAQTVVNTFDGTSFTSSTAMNTGRRGHGSVGTTTANLVTCGEAPRTANTELWNGSSWTEVNDYPAATQDLSVWGTSTSALGAAGYDTANSANSASWDGTSWTETADIANARNGCQTGGIGSDNTEGLIAGGDNSGKKTFTEEFGFPPPTAAILTEGDIFLSGGTTLKGFGTATGIPTGTWASGGTMNTGRFYGQGAGVNSNAALAMMGGSSTSALTQLTESYDGTSFTEVNDSNTARDKFFGFGTSAAALAAGGNDTPTANVESWDGTNWTEVNNLNTSRRQGMGLGTSAPASIAVSGYSTTRVTNTESWDGTSWTEISEVNTARLSGAAGGTSAEGVVFAGEISTGVTNHTETWDGSSWTEVNNLNTSRYFVGGAGTSTLALCFGGFSGSADVANNEVWNGTSWTELNDLSAGKRPSGGSKGSASNALAAGGGPPAQNTSEEFIADATLSTVTVS